VVESLALVEGTIPCRCYISPLCIEEENKLLDLFIIISKNKKFIWK
jgi:hypothetical protein